MKTKTPAPVTPAQQKMLDRIAAGTEVRAYRDTWTINERDMATGAELLVIRNLIARRLVRRVSREVRVNGMNVPAVFTFLEVR